MANKFHPGSKVSPLASIDISQRGTDTILGEGCVIDDFVKIKHVGGSGHVEIGDHSYLNSGTVLYSGNGIYIGNSVLIGPNCSLTPVNHQFSATDIPIRLQGFMPSRGGIIIEDDVWIGACVTILDGAIIRKGCIIGANSMVNGDTEPYGIYFGTPAKLVKMRVPLNP
jgi:acetyltransferase-like isoleucine patch superfamily enzyme